MNNEDKINLDIKEEMNNDGNNKTKKQSYLNTEKLNPNIKIKPINILNANEIVNKVLKSNDDNHISNKLKNFDIMIDEDDIYFENNQNIGIKSKNKTAHFLSLKFFFFNSPSF